MFKSCEDAKDIYINDDNIENRVEHIKHFLETMLNPELTLSFFVCNDSPFEQDVKVSTQLQMLTRVASPKCSVMFRPKYLEDKQTKRRFKTTTKFLRFFRGTNFLSNDRIKIRKFCDYNHDLITNQDQ